MVTGINDADFRTGIMPRVQLSLLTSQLAVDKALLKSVKEFAGFELMETMALVEVLKDMGTPVPDLCEEHHALLSRLKTLEGNNFDKVYLEAELVYHKFLRDLAQSYLNNSDGTSSAIDRETRHLATIALFAFKEHIILCKRIFSEVSAV